MLCSHATFDMYNAIEEGAALLSYLMTFCLSLFASVLSSFLR